MEATTRPAILDPVLSSRHTGERILTVEDLSVEIPVGGGLLRPVQRVSFHVDRGETVCIVGESGCGKSLTALAIMDLLPSRARRTATALELSGQSLVGIGERAMSDLRGNRMAMIFQEPMTSLNPSYTIGNQLAEAFLRHRAASRREARDRAVHLLERVGITAARERLRQYPHQLSGGLRQRVMIAMALMCAPDLIIADEPTTALDVTIQAQILHLLAELQREMHMGLVLITHDLGIVARIATRVIVMYAGQVVEAGSARAVFSAPAHPYTRGLLACIPIPGRTRRGERLGTIPGMVPTLLGDLSGCHFADRCPHVRPVCRQAPIALEEAAGGRQVRCVRHAELTFDAQPVLAGQT
jgi:peptide/nickel transport system ATP-binding protein